MRGYLNLLDVFTYAAERLQPPHRTLMPEHRHIMYGGAAICALAVLYGLHRFKRETDEKLEKMKKELGKLRRSIKGRSTSQTYNLNNVTISGLDTCGKKKEAPKEKEEPNTNEATGKPAEKGGKKNDEDKGGMKKEAPKMKEEPNTDEATGKPAEKGGKKNDEDKGGMKKEAPKEKEKPNTDDAISKPAEKGNKKSDMNMDCKKSDKDADGKKDGYKDKEVPSGDIQTQPNAKIVFNSPYDIYHIKITNSSARRIGWAIKKDYRDRLNVEPPCGVLDPKEAVLVAISCNAFEFASEDTGNNSITIEWKNTPEGAAKEFFKEWFLRDGAVRSKNLLIEYNM
uniref:Major sperm protein n=1 Tax=Acrobeloides nanus TaxID=290746 RepID=A0A914BW32_9BILA